MGLFRKKEKKKKEKKPITVERVAKWLTPLLLIFVIFMACYETYQGCDSVVGDYQAIETELKKDFQVSTFLTSNRIISSDKTTLKEKLREADVPIFVQGEISNTVFNNLLNIYLQSNLRLTDCELGELCNYIIGEEYSSFKYKIFELTIDVLEDGTITMLMVAQIDLSNIDLGIKIDMSSLKNICIKSKSVIKIENNKVSLNSTNVQINNLNASDTETMMKIINLLFMTEKDFVSQTAINLINDIVIKTDSRIEVSKHYVSFLLNN